MRGFQIFVLLIAGLAVGFLIRSKFAGDSKPSAITNQGQAADAEPASIGVPKQDGSVNRVPVHGPSTPDGNPVVGDELLRQTFDGLYREHVDKLRAIDEARYQEMMTKPDDRFLTRGVARYESVESEIPPPNLESFLGIGFAGEVEMSNVLEHQAVFLDELSRGKKSVEKIQLAENLTLFELPIEAIVASLRKTANLDSNSGSALNLASIRDAYLGQFALAHEEEWFIISAVRKTYLNLGLPINYDEEELRRLFPEYNRVRAEKDALGSQYLRAVQSELGL